MSDAAITVIVTGLGTIVTTVVTFLTLWVRLKYSISQTEQAADKVRAVEVKLDQNTDMTARVVKQTNGGLDVMVSQVGVNTTRIAELEGEVKVLKMSLEGLARNIDSTRHEVRGHFQTVMNKLDLAMLRGGKNPPPPSPD
jgi:hypothetical protein